MEDVFKTLGDILRPNLTFGKLPNLEFFSVSDEFGEAFFMKRTKHVSICIESNDGTYEKGKRYYFQDETVISQE